MFKKLRKNWTEYRNLASANYRLNFLEQQIVKLRDELDAVRSSFEVSPQLMQEFLEWKARTPIPRRPLVSVCVPTYNRARLLTERCIPSVLQQTYQHFELIVVGDGCTDETEKSIARINDPRLKFLNLPERGQYPADPIRRWMVAGTPAINKSMALAQGDYVTHLDDDDEYMPERLESLVEFGVDNKCDFVWHPFWIEDAEGNWGLNDARSFSWGSITTSAVFYRCWFKRIEWNLDAHYLMEPGDWNRFRRIKYMSPSMMRYDKPLVKHYRERNNDGTIDGTTVLD